MASSQRGDLDLSFKEAGEVGGDKDDYSNSVTNEGFPIVPCEPGSGILKPSAEVVGDEDTDDDCIILDGDPNKSLVVVANEYEDDDLKIVGEKGKIACRDFPHPRYLCATFPFASTLHELHCGQCYCYVCDSLAPCTHWDTTISSTDHCHATHTEEHWRTERKLVKGGDLPAPVMPSMADGTYLIQALRTPEFPTLDLQPPKPLTPETINPSNVSLLNAVNQGRTPATSGFPLHISNPQSHLLSPQSHLLSPQSLLLSPQSHLLSPQSYPAFNNNSNIASRGDNNVRTLRWQSFLNRVSFKRSGLVRPSLNHRQGYGSQSCTNSSLNWSHTHLINAVGQGSNQLNTGSPAVPAPSVPTSLQPNFSSPLITYPIHLQSQLAASSQPYPNASIVSYVPSPSHVASWPSPRGVSSSSIAFINNHLLLPSMSVSPRLNMVNEFGSQLAAPSRPYPNASIVSYVPSPSHVASWPSPRGVSSSSIAFRNNHLLLPSMSVSPRLNMVNEFGSRSLQPPEHENTAALWMSGQNGFEQGSHSQSGARVSSWPNPRGVSSSSFALRNNHLLLPSMGVSPRLNMVNGFGSRSLQPPEHDNTASVLMGGQNGLEQGNHSQSGARVSSSGFGGSAWDFSSIIHDNPADFMQWLRNQQPQ